MGMWRVEIYPMGIVFIYLVTRDIIIFAWAGLCALGHGCKPDLETARGNWATVNHCGSRRPVG